VQKGSSQFSFVLCITHQACNANKPKAA